jgi:hypothetical protein
MMDEKSPQHLLSEALRQKAERRRRAAQRPFGEKIAIIEELRRRLRPLKNAKPVSGKKPA